MARGQTLYRQVFSRGRPEGPLDTIGKIHNRRGTRVRFHPDEQIFGKNTKFLPRRLFKMARSKAYLFGGVEIRWSCAACHLADDETTPATAVLRFPGGLRDFLSEAIAGKPRIAEDAFAGKVQKPGDHGSVEWAVAWFGGGDGFINSYCNTVPTPKAAPMSRGCVRRCRARFKAYADLKNNKRASSVTAEDIMASPASCSPCSSAIRNFRGRPRKSSPPPKPPASSRPRCAIISITG